LKTNFSLKRRKWFPLSLFLSVLLAHSVVNAAQRKAIAARWVEQPINIDGQLDEPAWALAQSVSDFVQVEPLEGGAPTEHTEVRILFDAEKLYIGVYLYDSEPDRILTNDLQRDFESRESDAFGVIIDSFHNYRTSFSFFTNPGSAKNDRDAQGDGRYRNPSWDSIWYTASTIQEDGWSCEIAIPFSTLRFEERENQAMGINFKRRIRRKNEDLYWSLVPSQYTSHRVSLAGDLLFDRAIQLGRNLQVKPFTTMNFTQTRSGSEESKEFTPEVGLDVKYSVTPGLTLDTTLNTDFSQVEVDAEQINLTRFSLFFPEKRDFFLENADLFQFGDLPGERGPRRNQETQLFYSRRIGLSESGLPLPLLGGARLSGRTGRFALGVFNIHQMEDEEEPSNNFSVVRLRYDVLGNSDIGAIFIDRQGGDPGDSNRSYGVDANLQPLQHLTINSFLAKTITPNLEGNDFEAKISSQWDDGFLLVRGIFADIGENFNPEVGLVPRSGVRTYQYNLALKPRPEGIGFIREFRPHSNTKYFTDRNNVTLTKDSHYGFEIKFSDGGTFEASHNPQFERLIVPFEIREGIIIQPGDYSFNEFKLLYNSDRSQPLSGSFNLEKGGFFDGNRTNFALSGTLLVKPRFSASVNYTYNLVEVEAGSFRADLYSVRGHYSFNPRISADLFVQYNQDTGKILTNARFNWIHRPLSDMSVVFTEERIAGSSTDVSRAFIFKYTHLFQF
jgi:hypothetical protein